MRAGREEGTKTGNPFRAEIDRRKEAIEIARLQLKKSELNEKDKNIERMLMQGAIPRTTREGLADEVSSWSGIDSGIEMLSMFSDVAANAVDNRFFFDIQVGGLKIKALHDPGAMRSYIDRGIADKFNRKVKKTPTRLLRNATGGLTKITGSLEFMINIAQLSKSFAFKVVPQLDYPMIIGIDFLKYFKVKVDYDEKLWQIGNGPWYNFGENEGKSTALIVAECAGIREATPDQAARLQELLDRLQPASEQDKPGCAKGVEFEIELEPGAVPVRHRIRRQSPAVLEEYVKQTEALRYLGVVEECSSPWSSAPVLVVRGKKK